MAGPLRNTRHERFCQALLEGQNVVDAFTAAGFVRDTGNAVRLSKNPAVIGRVRELQNEVAGASKITVASLLDELEEARKRADSLDQLSTVVKAVSKRPGFPAYLCSELRLAPPATSAPARRSRRSWTSC